MTDIIIQSIIGLFAGFAGGLLGIGGSIVIIPCLIVYFSHLKNSYGGETQHLLQASAMICNFFVSLTALITHKKAKAIIKPIIIKLIPSAIAGILLGVFLSNSTLLAREKGVYLAAFFSLFLIYVATYNFYQLIKKKKDESEEDSPNREYSLIGIIAVGLTMGLMAGLLGVGGGVFCVPAQQLVLRIPLKKAIANSATTITFIAFFGAIYKNASLPLHNIEIATSVKLAATLIPSAIIGSFLGAKVVHALPIKKLRLLFALFLAFMAYQTYKRSLEAIRKPTPVEIVTYRFNKAESSELFKTQEMPLYKMTDTSTISITSIIGDICPTKNKTI